MKIQIQQGQIWKVLTDDFCTTVESNKFSRPIKLIKNELIEIRYPYEWHFRTLDNNYWHAKPDQIIQHCELFGIIWGNVKFNNKCDLADIIKLSLYEPENENSYTWAKEFDREFLVRMKLEKLISDLCDKHKKSSR